MSGCPTNRRRLGNLTRRKHHNVSRSLSWCHLQYHLNHKANLVYRWMAKKQYSGQMQFSIVTDILIEYYSIATSFLFPQCAGVRSPAQSGALTEYYCFYCHRYSNRIILKFSIATTPNVQASDPQLSVALGPPRAVRGEKQTDPGGDAGARELQGGIVKSSAITVFTDVQKNYLQVSKKCSQVRCPKCRSRLRVWPENHGPPFTCSSSTCPVVGRLRSTGANRFEIRETTENHLLFRFTCFLCNFDLCESCLTRKLGRSLLNPEPSRTPARETSSSCSRGRESWCFGPTAANSGPMDPSAPLLPVHEEPPPSYQEAIKERE